jgi:hypothetical protein
MDHSKMDEGKMAGDTGHTTGVIFSISPDGKEATIDHQEIEGVGMGAMTMGFGQLHGQKRARRQLSHNGDLQHRYRRQRLLRRENGS